MQHFIITGGIGAGKTNLINNIASTGEWLIGSPATTMKRLLAQVIARTYNGMGNDNSWHFYYEEMMGRSTKEKYRGILQGYGEFFSNQDNFFWIRKVMNEIEQELQNHHFQQVEVAGTVYDSIRRPAEIYGIREMFPDAILVHLNIGLNRQTAFLRNILGYSITKAHETLVHASEHWLDSPPDPSLRPDIIIDANYGDEYILESFWKGVEKLGKH